MSNLKKLDEEQKELTKKIIAERRRIWNAKAPKLVGKFYGHVCRNDHPSWDSHKAIYYKIVGCSTYKRFGVWLQITVIRLEIVPDQCATENRGYHISVLTMTENPEDDVFEEIDKREWIGVCSETLGNIENLFGVKHE